MGGLATRFLGRFERALQIGNQVLWVFQANRQADGARANASGGQGSVVRGPTGP